MIIGIAGNINSGKDTVASILLYLMIVGKHKAKYSDWLLKKEVYLTTYKHKITHFADGIKDNLSRIFLLDRDLFDNRKFKDELWFNPFTGKFIDELQTSGLHKIELENYLELDVHKKHHIVKLRTLIQMYAEQCKIMFGQDVWVTNTIGIANSISNTHKICLIPDVRFERESSAIQKSGGIIIKLNRLDNPVKVNHVSENNEISYTFLIENEGSLFNLYNKVLAIYDKLKI